MKRNYRLGVITLTELAEDLGISRARVHQRFVRTRRADPEFGEKRGTIWLLSAGEADYLARGHRISMERGRKGGRYRTNETPAHLHPYPTTGTSKAPEQVHPTQGMGEAEIVDPGGCNGLLDPNLMEDNTTIEEEKRHGD